jgi:hypothetical protein
MKGINLTKIYSKRICKCHSIHLLYANLKKEKNVKTIVS